MFDNEGIICEPVPQCAICGSAGKTLYRDLSDELFDLPGKWSFRECGHAGCGTGWVDPRPISQELGKLYERYYTHEAVTAENLTEEKLPSNRNMVLKKLLTKLLWWQSAQFSSNLLYLGDMTPGRLLDMGCGSGEFLFKAMRRGWQVDGLDFDERAVAAANRLENVVARVGDLDHPDLLPGSYDAITMNHVIEHVYDPKHSFARCATLLRPGGRLVLVTPNMEAQGLKIFGPHWRGLEIPRHLHLFTAKSLKKLAISAGFSRVQAFSPIGGHETASMITSSSEISVRSGKVVPKPSEIAMRAKTAISSLLGKSRGEFVVLVAEL